VLRTSPELADLRGNWYLGVYNNETTNVSYTIRAAVGAGGLLLSGQLPQAKLSPMPPPHGRLFQWNAVEGEYYIIEFSPTLAPPAWVIVNNGLIRATTPLATFEVPLPPGRQGFYRVRQISAYMLPPIPMIIQPWPGNLLRISWSTAFAGETLQWAPSPAGPWSNVNLPVVIEGTEYVVYDPLGTEPRYYRLIP